MQKQAVIDEMKVQILWYWVLVAALTRAHWAD